MKYRKEPKAATPADCDFLILGLVILFDLNKRALRSGLVQP